MEKIMARIKKFSVDRKWQQLQQPDNLAKSLMIEAAELLKNYQWGAMSLDMDNVKDEIADVLSYTLQLCMAYQLDPVDLLNAKYDKNERKYPIEVVMKEEKVSK